MDKNQLDKYRDDFNRDGFVMMKNAISKENLVKMKLQLDEWVDDSRNYSTNYGTIMDGRPRFDLEYKSHSKDTPALRRISSPIEISETYLSFTRNNAGLNLIAHIFSPNIKLIATKINLKLPSSGTKVKYHQDFPFEPHSNDNLMTALYFLDDVTLENGPLEVVPGSHKKEIYSHWQDGIFIGAVDENIEKIHSKHAVKCIGNAGDACLMHTRVLHGSLSNKTKNSRSLFIATYAAEDAVALDKNHIPHIYDGEVVKGIKTGKVRTSLFDMELPEYPKETSFFGQQSKSIN